ncbi:MMPL family transporter [Halomarina ordinaria]|uniref:MMPL family transporter n=1 Tax=Halomarina ordinaria TaxID=3033939 RepID=A0ABD5UCE8_9EURY|nr:MMPL family transporter [Halomarina sp. PSRA2]
MSRVDRLVRAITDHTRVAIVLMLVATLLLGSGAGMIDQSSSLDQFQSDSPESEKLEYIEANFSTGANNTTTVQVVARDDDVLDKESLLALLELEQRLRANETVNRTLTDDDAVVGMPTLVATTALQQEAGEELQATNDEFQALNATVTEERRAIEERSADLNATADDLEGALTSVRGDVNASTESEFDAVRANTSAELNETDLATFQRAAGALLVAENETQVDQAYQLGTQGVLAEEYRALEQRGEDLERQGERLSDRAEEFEALNATVTEERRAVTERSAELNATADDLRGALTTLQQDPNASAEAEFDAVRANTSVELNETDFATFQRAADDLRTAENETEVRQAYQLGTQGVLAEEYRALEQRGEDLERQGERLADQGEELQDRNAAVTEERRAIEERSADLDATATDLREALTSVRGDANESAEAEFDAVRANTSVELNETDLATFQRATGALLVAENETQVDQAYRLGTQGVLAEDYRALEQRGEDLERQGERLGDLGEELQDRNAAFENASNATLAEQREQLASMNESEVDETLSLLLGESDDEGGSGDSPAVAFVPTDYETGSGEAEATMLLVTQRTDGETDASTGAASDRITDAQLAMQAIATEQDDRTLVFGGGIIGEEINQSMTDSLVIVGPLALLFVLLALAVAYRDLLDIVLGFVGILAVLVWTFGFMGWAGIAFNQLFVAVPVLLIGLSIDYAIHVFMRHREERERTEGVRPSMRVAMAGVGVALVWVTATTVIGFLSNLTSPVPPIQEFGVVSSVGITAALLVFGVMIPALKIELDTFLEGRGIDRQKRAFGTGGGRFSSVLATGATAARRAPVAVILVALLVSAGGVYGASQVSTSFNQEDFLADDPPAWMDDLPEPFAPNEYTAKSNLDYVNENFVREDSQAQILVEGSVTDPSALERVAAAERDAAESDVVQVLSDDEADIQSPLSVMEGVAAENETFNATFEDADTDGDGVPDQDVEEVYDALYEVAPDEAESVVYRTDDGEYEALRLVISTQGNAPSSDVTDEMRALAADIDGDGLEATATGQSVLFDIVQNQLLQTVVESLIVTLVAVFAFLMLTYRVTEGSATLGAVTLLPVVLSVSWILGTMYLLDIPFNILTGMITSLTVGLGVAYSIHLSERFNQELERTGDLWESMRLAVTGTGGALLGSAATTVGGFGVLAFAILPPLRQFGIITGLTIIYAFLASVLVLPSLLVVWHRYLGPGRSATTGEQAATASPAED